MRVVWSVMRFFRSEENGGVRGRGLWSPDFSKGKSWCAVPTSRERPVCALAVACLACILWLMDPLGSVHGGGRRRRRICFGLAVLLTFHLIKGELRMLVRK